jgi:LemA protein
MLPIIIVVILIIVIIGYVIGVQNILTGLKYQVDEAWSNIDTQLKKRFDLIPNLVDTVKGYASHEKEVFQKVTEARSNAMQAQGPEASAQAENMLSGALKSLFAVAENYPELKANENFMHLQQTLNQTETDLQRARLGYNSVVTDYNTKVEIFPNNIVAGFLHFDKRKFFEIAEQEKQNVKVSF